MFLWWKYFGVHVDDVFAAEVLWMCTFDQTETGSDWCSLIQDNMDVFDWTMQSGPTPSEVTGPPGAFEGTYYIYIETSNPRVLGDDAK